MMGLGLTVDRYWYDIGWDAARLGDTRDWCAGQHLDCVAGYDAYWALHDPR